MTAGWQSKLARIARMDWDEISTRAGQGLHKRWDLLRHQLGMRPEEIRLGPDAGQGKFFFAPGEAATRAALLSQHLPQEAAEIIREADEICRHRFRLLGYENLDYGVEIDWHLDRVHGKRAQLDPWFRIPFLDFAVVGDHKITWELNRHQQMVTLAKAWLLTHDEKYVQELMAQWRNWVKANPYPLGINWGSTLEIAFRSLSWIWVDHLVGDHPTYSEFRRKFLPELAFHGRYIERYLSTYFSPNTHLLGEAVTMFFLGTLYPQMPHAQRWKETGWKIVLHEAGRQVRPDGVYFEHSLYYHVYALDFCLYARQLAVANDLRVPPEFDNVLLHMLDVIETLAQAGPPEGYGDDDGGRVFNPRRNQTEHMTDPLAIGALAYNRAESRAQLTEEAIWMFGQRAIDELERLRPSAVASVAFPDGGVYVLADSDPFPQTLMIDAGPQGVGRCGHGHADALSLRLSINGSRWLVDSGSGVYISSNPADRNTFRGTAAHNTLRVDGVDQAVPREPFSWTDIPETRADNWIQGKTFTYFSGSHNGYERLPDPVTHRRSVLLVNDALWLVHDVAIGKAEHNLELRWHFASDVSICQAGAGELVASRPGAEGPVLRIITPAETAWKAGITRGLLSPAYGRYQSAPLACSEARVKLPAEMATALIVQSQATQTREPARMAGMHHAAVEVYELHDGGRSYGFFFARGQQPWSFGPWASDAELLYCRLENEKIVQLIVIGGSSVTWQGQVLLKAHGPSRFFEWRRQDGLLHAEPEPFSLSHLFRELTGASIQHSALNIQTTVSHND